MEEIYKIEEAKEDKEKINEDINNVIDSIYNNEELTISTEQITSSLLTRY